MLEDDNDPLAVKGGCLQGIVRAKSAGAGRHRASAYAIREVAILQAFFGAERDGAR